MDTQMTWQYHVKARMTVNGCEGLAVARVIQPGKIDFLVESLRRRRIRSMSRLQRSKPSPMKRYAYCPCGSALSAGVA